MTTPKVLHDGVVLLLGLVLPGEHLEDVKPKRKTSPAGAEASQPRQGTDSFCSREAQRVMAVINSSLKAPSYSREGAKDVRPSGWTAHLQPLPDLHLFLLDVALLQGILGSGTWL